jgi:phosphatidylserine/phosphatidylglycerophosphate/cardiolipin synthase-like enzyme
MKRIALSALIILSVFLSISAFSEEKDPVAHYKILFSPDGQVADELIALIKKENKSIKAAVYCLMHRGISKALIDAHKRGVDVEVIVDPYSVKSRAPVKTMQAASLPVFVWNPPEVIRVNRKGKSVKQKKPLMHDKFCVLGDSKVWTGSFNFTFQASSANRENVVLLESKEAASQYLKEFERLKKSGCVPLKIFLDNTGV